ncbi:MAG TPA: DUF488 domain-containing protein [Thermoplasmata archaeon]|nr:DUF488 domain-containing protein [Thermoplasmata archaeon]
MGRGANQSRQHRPRTTMIRIKRAYEPASRDDGVRVLIDRLWPRGVTKEAARIDVWRKELAPSPDLRTWFDHDPVRYPRFRERYRKELLGRRDELASLIIDAERGPLTLIYAAKDSQHCNAAVLKELLEEIMQAGSLPERSGRTRVK